MKALLAQLVERETEVLKVAGSIPAESIPFYILYTPKKKKKEKIKEKRKKKEKINK